MLPLLLARGASSRRAVAAAVAMVAQIVAPRVLMGAIDSALDRSNVERSGPS